MEVYDSALDTFLMALSFLGALSPLSSSEPLFEGQRDLRWSLCSGYAVSLVLKGVQEAAGVEATVWGIARGSPHPYPLKKKKQLTKQSFIWIIFFLILIAAYF